MNDLTFTMNKVLIIKPNIQVKEDLLFTNNLFI